METVLGIGGLFFRSRDPDALSAWYATHLGIPPVPRSYEQPAWQQQAGPTAFAPFPADTDYFGAASESFMTNLRVRDLDAMVRQLRAAGIEVTVDEQAHLNGRFARLQDPEGHPIELWQPVDPACKVARGHFEVRLGNLPLFHDAPEALLSRRSLEKEFHGDLVATSRGEMLSAGSVAQGSAGYVAIERVRGALEGRVGGFTLQHHATMNRGKAVLSISVVPDSGTDALTGLEGSLSIRMEGGQHVYEFEYRLTPPPA